MYYGGITLTSRTRELTNLSDKFDRIVIKSTRRKKALRRLHLTEMEKNAIIDRQLEDLAFKDIELFSIK